MSFYFMKKDREAAAKRPLGAKMAARGAFSGPAGTPAARQSIGALHRLGCKACPLDRADCSTPKMPPRLAAETDVFFLGQSPGADEDERSGKPFTGPSGKLLRELIPEEYARNCSYDNVLNCRPPNDRPATWVEMECCRPRHIKAIEEAKPRIVVGLGGDALQWATGSNDMVGMRGRLFAVQFGGHKCWFLPTYHPAFILRIANEKDKRTRRKSDPLNSMFGHCLRMDVKRAFDALRWIEPPEIDSLADVPKDIATYDGSRPEDFRAVGLLLKNALKAKYCTIDVETKGLRPYSAGAKVLSCALTVHDVNFSWAIDHPESKFTKDQRQTLLELLAELLYSGVIKIAHNVPFECEWLAWLLGPETIRHHVWCCTMAQSQFVDERKGKHRSDDSDNTPVRYQALGWLCKQYFGVNPKDPFKLPKDSMDKAPIKELLTYNGADTKYTERLYWVQMDRLKLTGRHKAYIESGELQPTVALMQRIGVCVDQPLVKSYQSKLKAEIDPLEAAIFGDPTVKQYIKHHREFNPDKQGDVLALFRDYLKRPEVFVKDRRGEDRESVDRNILLQIDHPLARAIIEYRHKTKLKATYVDGLELRVGKIIYPDGKLHTNFNTTIAETSRLSSDGPNLQNYPSRHDKWVRKLVVPLPNHIFIAIDYGALEACTGAMCSLDKFLTKALWEDYDIHMEWARRAADIEPGLIGGRRNLEDADIMGKFRSLIKNKLVFPAFFGASSNSVRGYLHAATEFDIDQSKVDDLMDEFWGYFGGMAKWQDRTMQRYYNEGYVETLHCRRRHYPLTRNQAINHPIQGTAAGLVCDAMTRLSKLSFETGIDYIHPVLNVHDDLTFMVPDDDKVIEDALNIIMPEMLCFEYPWVNVPMSIEVSIGRNWCDMEKLGKFFSHKEYGYPHKEGRHDRV